MKLTPDQHEQFARDGYLFFPGLFSRAETATLGAAVPELYSRREAYNVREKGKDAVRTNFAAHFYSEPFARLARHPRMVEPVQEQLVERAGGKNGGIVSPKGPAGSMILFHGCLVHASGSNLSPWDRVSVYLSLCAVSNHIRRFKRPEYIAHRDFTPIACLPDDCLLKDYPVELPWKSGMPASALETSLDKLKIAA